MKQEWRTVRLGDLLKIQNGFAFSSKQFSTTEGMPLVRIRSLKSGTEDETFYSGPFDKQYLVNAGDLLIGMDGEFGCYEWKGPTALLNQRVCRLQDFNEELLPRFLYYGINSHLKAIESATGFTTVKHLSSSTVLNIVFPVPPLAEQQRIVRLLDEAFKGIAIAKANAEKNLQNAHALFKSVLQVTFTQNGEEWSTTSLADSCVMYQPKTISVRNLAADGKYPVYGANGLIGHHDEFNHEEPQLLIGCRGTCGVVHVSQPYSWVTGNAMVIRPKDGSLDMRFLEYLFRGGIDIAGAITGTAQPQITRSSLLPLKFAYPVSVETQLRIVARLDRLTQHVEKLTELYSTQSDALDALEKSMLDNAFKGRLLAA